MGKREGRIRRPVIKKGDDETLPCGLMDKQEALLKIASKEKIRKEQEEHDETLAYLATLFASDNEPTDPKDEKDSGEEPSSKGESKKDATNNG